MLAATTTAEGNPMDGATFRELRTRIRLSQGELADKLNAMLQRSYDKPKLSRWENGRDPVPDDVALALRQMANVRKARVVAFVNQKGGVGKTTSAVNVAYAASAQGAKVLLVDMDAQASATAWLLLLPGAIEAYRRRQTTFHLLLQEVPFEEAVVRAGTDVAGRSLPFDFLPSHIDLMEADTRREPGLDIALKLVLDRLRGEYDLIVIDGPPNLGMLTWMLLAAADEVLIPVRTEPIDIMGVGLILATLRKVQRRTNMQLRIGGVLPTQYQRRKSVDREVLVSLRGALGEIPVLEPVEAAAVFGKAASEARITLEHSPRAPALAVYSRIADALLAGRPLPAASLDTADTEA